MFQTMFVAGKIMRCIRSTKNSGGWFIRAQSRVRWHPHAEVALGPKWPCWDHSGPSWHHLGAILELPLACACQLLDRWFSLARMEPLPVRMYIFRLYSIGSGLQPFRKTHVNLYVIWIRVANFLGYFLIGLPAANHWANHPQALTNTADHTTSYCAHHPRKTHFIAHNIRNIYTWLRAPSARTHVIAHAMRGPIYHMIYVHPQYTHAPCSVLQRCRKTNLWDALSVFPSCIRIYSDTIGLARGWASSDLCLLAPGSRRLVAHIYVCIYVYIYIYVCSSIIAAG